MCEIMTALAIGGFAASAASAGVGYAAQSQAAEDQAKYQNEMYSETAKSAIGNYYGQVRQSQFADQQNVAATGIQAEQNRIAALQARSSARVAAGESGVSGTSVDQLMLDYNRAEAGNMSNLQTNLYWQRAQQGEELKAAQAEAKSRVAGATPGPVRLPSILATGLQIASAGINSAVSYRAMTPDRTSTFKIPTRTNAPDKIGGVDYGLGTPMQFANA